MVLSLTAEWAAAPSASYPDFLRGDEPIASGASDSMLLTGRAISPGVASGPVHVVLEIGQFASVPQGCVLVAPSSDPGWTPLFPRLSALVLETGGQLSHAAVVAREYGLPAVAGIASATTILRQGELVTVDGSTGIVVRSGPHEHGALEA